MKTAASSTTVTPSHDLTIYIEEEASFTSKGDFHYKEVSEISDVTEESFPEGLEMLREGAKDLENYDKLME